MNGLLARRLYYTALCMQKIIQALKSRTVWTLVALFAVNGVAGIHALVPAVALPYLDGFLGIAAVYFKLYPSQTYGK